MQEVIIQKLVFGGQGMGELSDGRKVFVWGVLPGERIAIRVTKKKNSYVEAVVEEVLESSPLRVSPKEPNYLATSPWQIMDIKAENDYKQRILVELFAQAHVTIPSFAVQTAGDIWRYRNKMEYSFWGDDQGIHLALYNRGSHQKMIVDGSELAMPVIDVAANEVLKALQASNVRAGDLKTIILRADNKGQTVAALFVKAETFPRLDGLKTVKGLQVYYSNPKSPASVPTRLLYQQGSAELSDTVLGKEFKYDVNSFFQVNIPVFECALQRILSELDKTSRVVDMYSGVGSIGLSVATQAVDMIEVDPSSAAMARDNARSYDGEAHVIETSSEKALEYIDGEAPLIVDPPRAGLHPNVTKHILSVQPPKVVYLSCNPSTQARDVASLLESYEVTAFEAFNFFPHTPHIETLVVLTRKQRRLGDHGVL